MLANAIWRYYREIHKDTTKDKVYKMPEDKTPDKRKRMSMAEMLTYSTVQIHCDYPDNVIGSGTGFIINICKNKKEETVVPILVTNRHVIKNSTRISFELCLADDDGNPIDTKTYEVKTSIQFWVEHPDHNVDLCCLPLAQVLKHTTEQGIKLFYIPLEVELIPGEDGLKNLTALEDVVMVGYPKGLEDFHNHKPIIRHGVTATHPKNDFQGKKEILLDIAAFPGSSGSPVFIFNQGAYSTSDGGFRISSRPRVLFLGVLYGGPEFDVNGVLKFSELPSMPIPITRLPVNLGIIIKSERIREFEKLFSPPTGKN